MGTMVPPSRKSCYNFRVTEINRVVDGDTIDVTIDLGFDLYKKERVRVAGVDTPEKRTRDLEEKALGIDATEWIKDKLEGAIDGDTIDVTIDLGFDLYKKERVRIAGVDTPEKRTRDLEEKALGIDATNWMKDQLEGAIDGDDELTIRTELQGGVGKYGRLLGWLYVGYDDVSLNEQMIGEGYAWPYDGGTKQKDFEELRQLRRARGTLTE